MKFRIPFAFSDAEKLKKRSKFFISKIRHKKESKFVEYLKNCDAKISREEYLGVCLRNLLINFTFLFIISTTIFAVLKINLFFIFGILFSFLFSGFIYFSQIIYPKIYVARKQRDIEKNLIPALQDILVQLNSGVPLFGIMVNISSSDYGTLSLEFKKAVKKINAGEPESEVLNQIGKDNPSVFFRRTLWQISNGIIAGSDMAIVIKNSIRALSEEQLIQIQDYGSKLNPLVVMYMIITVIIPTLSITFLTVLSSMINMEKNQIILLFLSLFVFVIFAQIMFLGIIKSRRPSLL